MFNTHICGNELLSFNNKDRNKVFTRKEYVKNNRKIYFKWDNNLEAYCYVELTPNGYKFKKSHTDSNRNRSIVGNGVLGRTDVIEIKIREEVKEMRNVNYIGEFKVVGCKYNEYDEGMHIFKVTSELLKELNEDDLLVVESNRGLGMVKVVKLYVEGITQETIEAVNKAKAWVIDKVDMTAHTARQQATERKQFLLAELNRRKEAIEEQAVWDFLADKDSTAKALLAELKELS